MRIIASLIVCLLIPVLIWAFPMDKLYKPFYRYKEFWKCMVFAVILGIVYGLFWELIIAMT